MADIADEGYVTTFPVRGRGDPLPSAALFLSDTVLNETANRLRYNGAKILVVLHAIMSQGLRKRHRQVNGMPTNFSPIGPHLHGL